MKKLISNFLVAFILGSFVACLPSHAQGIMQERDAFAHAEFGEAIRVYSQLNAEEQGRALPTFWAGSSYMRRHDWKHAEPLLNRALGLNLPEKQKELCADFVDRIKTLRALEPPLMMTRRSNGFVVNVYAKDTPWAKGICAQLPTFFARANEAFPGESATINFYLFDTREPYDRFFSAWTHKVFNDPEKKHRGTGMFEILEFCQYYPSGKPVGEGNINDLYMRVLHEYSHALCATIYGDGFPMHCPQWLNESMADYFGWKYRPVLIPQQAPKLAALAKKFPPPTYQELCRELYSGKFAYTFADNVLLELLKGKPLVTYKQILSSAKNHNNDFDAGLKEATGKDPKVVYQHVVDRFWKSAGSYKGVTNLQPTTKDDQTELE